MRFPLDMMADGSAPQLTPVAWDERSLIAAAQAGDCEAFNQLALAYQSRIYSVAYYLLSDAASASDAMQETLLSAYRNLRSFRKGNSLKGWLYRIVTRKCYDLLRDARRRRCTPWDESCETDRALVGREAGPEVVVQCRELARRLEASLNTLAFTERQMVVLSDIHGLSYLEIARATGKPLGTVKSRLSRARAKLRAQLGHTVSAPGTSQTSVSSPALAGR